jgi:hypothetical protein
MSFIISTSNTGAHCLASGDCDSSIEHLSTAFKQSRDEVLKEASRRKASGSPPGGMEPGHDHHRSCGDLIEAWMTKAPEEVDLYSHYIYSSPIFIPLNANHNDAILVSVVVSFNLGLAFLEAARRDGGDWLTRSTRLRQGLKLFQYSFRLQRARGKKASQSILFFMATVNNIGVMYSNLGETSHANECFHQLLALLMCINANANEAGLASNYGAFLQNTTRVAASGKYAPCCVGAAAGAA